MESGSCVAAGTPENWDYLFGLDDPNFSDRILQLQIINYADTDHSLWARHTNTRIPDDVTTHAPHQKKSIHVSSLILAAKSRFFRKLFSNGMRESEQKCFTLQIEASEEASLMDLLNYMYSDNLPTALHALMDLLVISDKLEVDACMRECCRLLQDLPLTLESASLYWYLPPSVLESTTFQPLAKAAKQFLIARFAGLQECKEEVLNLPLPGIQAVLSDDNLRVTSENVVYDLVMAWAQKYYLNIVERQEILKTHLLHLVRFPFMETRKLLEEVQTCSDIDSELASKLVIRALYFKADPLDCKGWVAGENGNASQLIPRAYMHRLVKVVKFESPLHQCIVYFDLTKEEIERLSPGNEIRSERFHLGGLEFVLIAGRTNNHYGDKYFQLSVQVSGSASGSLSFYVKRRKSSDFFEEWGKDTCKFSSGNNIINLKSVEWCAKNNDFRNGILHLRVDLTIT